MFAIHEQLVRDHVGYRVERDQFRANGLVPAILYGRSQPPIVS